MLLHEGISQALPIHIVWSSRSATKNNWWLEVSIVLTTFKCEIVAEHFLFPFLTFKSL
jgi:hypothetical protein